MIRYRQKKISILFGSLLMVGAWWLPVQAKQTTNLILEKAVTTDDPTIPIEELELMLKPLTLDELEGEAQAWMFLLKTKVKELSDAEIAVKRKNRELQQTKEAVDALEDAKDALEEATDTKEKIETKGSAKDRIKALKAAEDAQEALEKAQESVEEAVKEEEKTKQDKTLQGAIDKAVEGTEQQKDKAKTSNEEVAKVQEKIGTISNKIITDEQQQKKTQQGIDQAKQNLEEAVEAKTEVKKQVLVNMTTLREERTALSDRFEVVLEELETKGGDVELYDKYIDAISGIKVDVTDTQGTWITIVGWLQSKEGGLRWANNIGKFLGIVAGFSILSLIVGTVLEKSLWMFPNMSAMLRQFVVRITRQGLFVVGIILGITALEVSIGPLMAMIGAAGFVVAFAFQNTLGNFANGLMILLYKPFDVGDMIEVAGVKGTVKDVNLVCTTINTLENKIIIVPNNSIWGNVIANETSSPIRAMFLTVRISYSNSITQALQVLTDIANSHPLVLKDPAPWIDTGELAEYAVNIWFMAYTKKEDYWTAYCDISRIIKERFEQEGIVIPLPQQEIYISQAMAKQEGSGAKTLKGNDLTLEGSHGQIATPKPHSSFPNGNTA
ncbi:MAG: mechanosensitive ion channel [Moorea sp. SIOASIH]|uniref:mechanosensitive ion channel domain-containing protein n=1 Tax=Moorena sp. SIOASIH TaxID=2607817 RepID=UPI0013BDFB26|nr:mechanosensitive ion channel domain-containing protein [Moorena sp. SIOASIH]NEO39776.1 mechanosensitive ion channel [Moorena sp. SIOASIH]